MARRKRVGTRTVVEGYGAFPIDMLRYDVCWPATEPDANLIARTFTHDAPPGSPWSIVVLSARASDATEGRWRSFGWRVASTEPVYR